MAKATWKLVRDKIPELMVDKADTKILDSTAYSKALAKKLDEEVKELKQEMTTARTKADVGRPPMVMEELADVLEVCAAIAEFHNINSEDLFDYAMQKRKDKGAFQKRIYMKFSK